MIAGLCALTAAAATAQDQELEQIIVTGSRITRADFESASPVATVPRARFEQTASATVETTLNSMPQFVGSYGATTNNTYVNGQAQASLRGLNNTETLVLVDGRRLVPSNGLGIPDLNLIPPALVERVEVLTGGSSAVYGSDAMAGVVNFRLRDRFHGLEFDGDWGATGSGDAETYTVGLTAGTPFAGNRGEVMASVGYSKRDQVDDGARKFSRVVLGYVCPPGSLGGSDCQFLPQGSPYIEEGRASVAASQEAFETLFASYGYAPGSVPTPSQNWFGFNADGTLFTQGNSTAGSVANFRGVKDPLTFSDHRYTYNYAPPYALQLPLERISVFGNARFKFNESAEAYAQALYGDYSVNQQLAPTPVPTVYMPATNPYIPPDLKLLLDSRADPAARVRLSKRTLETGTRVSQNDYSTYQATLGLRGTVFSDWQYNGYVQYGRSDATFDYTGNVSVTKFEELLYAPDGGQAICGGLDPFGLNSISAECASYVAVDLTDGQAVEQLTAEVSFSGSPLDLPAGELQTVFGLFYKSDTYSLRPDPAEGVFLPDGRPDVAGSTGGAIEMDGKDHNLDAYVEALVPIVADAPGVRSLRAGLGYRYSDYASAGGTSSYKVELLYQPVTPLRVRGSFQHAVRAPSVLELYWPQLVNIYIGINPPDPCSVGSAERSGPDAAAVAALCVNQGLPTSLLSTFDYQDDGVQGFDGGNPDLQPETGKTYTAGVVFDSDFVQPALRHLQVSLDWYDIDISNAIYTYPARLFVPYCYDPKYNPNFDVSNRYCSYFSRDPETGVIVDAYEINRNIGSVATSGVDLNLDWRFDLGAGQLGVTWLATWLQSYEWQGQPGVEGQQWRNTGCCPTLPEWKWNVNTRYWIGGLTADLVWAYVGHFNGYFPDGDFQVPARNYLDLTTGYSFDTGSLAGLTLRVGVTNLTNEEPPIFPRYAEANTDPSVYDVLGRRYFVSVRYAFGQGHQ